MVPFRVPSARSVLAIESGTHIEQLHLDGAILFPP